MRRQTGTALHFCLPASKAACQPAMSRGRDRDRGRDRGRLARLAPRLVSSRHEQAAARLIRWYPGAILVVVVVVVVVVGRVYVVSV